MKSNPDHKDDLLGSGIRDDDRFELLERRVVHDGKVIRLSADRIRLPNGHELVHDVVHLPSVVSVVPLLETTDGPKVVLVEQFRNAVGGYIHEVPAGHVDDGEDPELSARRELREETGYEAGSMTLLTTRLTTPGYSAQRMHYYLAEELTPGDQSLERTECLQVREYLFEDLLWEMLLGPSSAVRIVDSKSHLALLHVAVARGWILDGKSVRRR